MRIEKRGKQREKAEKLLRCVPKPPSPLEDRGRPGTGQSEVPTHHGQQGLLVPKVLSALSRAGGY